MLLNAESDNLNIPVNTRSESIFRDPDVVHELSRLRDNFVIVPADKASNNYTFVCKKHYVDVLIKRTWTSFTSWESHKLSDSFFLHQKCWTTTNQSSLPLEYRQITRSSICLTFIGFRRCTKIHTNIDSLRVHRSVRQSLCPFYLQKLLTHINQGLQKYCEAAYSRSEINQMWILKNSKELLDHLKSPKFQPYHKHQVLRVFDPLHNYFSPES